MEALEEELEGLSRQERLQKEIQKQKRLAMIKFGQRLFIGFLGKYFDPDLLKLIR